MRRLRRALVIAAYALVFWLALPVGLWRLAVVLDGWLGLSWTRHPLGWAVVLSGLMLMLAAMRVLWVEGRGLPVSALPPPMLARRGPYRDLRHPIYLGFNLALVGLGLALASAALTLIVAPLFLPAWIVYALIEERALLRRFGDGYRHYRRSVGLLPRVPGYEGARLFGHTPAVRLEGVEHLPREGPAILVANHCCYLDPVYVGLTTRRRIRFLATAEIFRYAILGLYARQCAAIPTRRYRTDAVACREMLRVLHEGGMVGLFAEGERAVLGAYMGAQPQVAPLLARLPYPVVPVGISGNYDCGPRWAGVLRRRPVTVRVGSPIVWNGKGATATLNAALRALLGSDAQPVHLAGLPRERLARVLWRCPRCLDARGWHAATLLCRTCDAQFTPAPDGGFLTASGEHCSLAALGQHVLSAPERETLVLQADAWRERSWYGDARPLTPFGRGTLEVGAWGLAFGDLHLSLAELRSVSTERADALQIATREGLWQFRPHGGSVFRLAALLDHAREAAHAARESAR